MCPTVPSTVRIILNPLMHRILLLTILFTLWMGGANARPSIDSLSTDTLSRLRYDYLCATTPRLSGHPDKTRKITVHSDRFLNRPGVQIAGTPLILFSLSAILYNTDEYVHDARNRYVSKFDFPYDDYLQFAPGVAVLGLKAAGVEGRSSWGRLGTAAGISTALTFGLVTSVKNTVHKWRPDRSGISSFPSGHTAVAFMTATWLHKEYGLTRSSFYSIAGYTAAALTGIGRQLNDKHWLSDVMAGAGIGILSANLGYYFTSLIFKDKGISNLSSWEEIPPAGTPPSFWNVGIGVSLLCEDLNFEHELHMRTRNGFSLSTEGAWFMNPYVGVGGKIGVQTNSLEVNIDNFLSEKPVFKNEFIALHSDGLGSTNILAGPFFSYPISKRWLLGTKLLTGCSILSSSRLKMEYESPMGNHEILVFRSRNTPRWTWQSGVSVTFVVNSNMGIRLFADYAGALRSPGYTVLAGGTLQEPEYDAYDHSHEYINSLHVGASVCAFFF